MHDMGIFILIFIFSQNPFVHIYTDGYKDVAGIDRGSLPRNFRPISALTLKNPACRTRLAYNAGKTSFLFYTHFLLRRTRLTDCGYIHDFQLKHECKIFFPDLPFALHQVRFCTLSDVCPLFAQTRFRLQCRATATRVPTARIFSMTQ